MADLPIIKAFVGRPVESDPQSLRDFYDEAKEIDAAYKSFRDQMKDMKFERANEILRQYPKLMISPTVDSIKQSVSSMDKMIDAISGSYMSDDKKRVALRSVERIRLRTVQLANMMMEGGTGKSETIEPKPGNDNEKELEELDKASKRFTVKKGKQEVQ